MQAQVVKAVGKQVDIEDPAYRNYAGTRFQSIVGMLIFDIVTIKRNAAVLQRYENNRCITTTKLLRGCIKNNGYY
ncbi:MAG: hypothetical protein K0S91_1547 [Nitrososphaeraceae archaeon]|jgi:hypothetical protein|nr:hypothetical protein [Nitrososphaeraceae archaeon]